MGIKQSDGNGTAVFIDINAKEGCFQQGWGENKQKFQPGSTSVDGILVGFSIEENVYEGKKSEQLRLKLKDTQADQPNQYVTLSLTGQGDAEKPGDASGFALRVLGKLLAADVSKPIEIKPWFAKAGTKLGDFTYEKDMAAVKIAQGGQSLKEDYGNGVTALPKLDPILLNGKPLVVNGAQLFDKSQWNAMLDPALDALQAKIEAAHGQSQTHGQGQHDGIDADDAAAAVQRARG